MSENITGIKQAAEQIQAIKSTIRTTLIGQEKVVDELLITLIAAGHILVEGVPGLGKTLLIRTLAASFGGQSQRIQFTPDLMPNDITGHVMLDLETKQMNIRRGPVFTNLLLADEINRAPAKTQSALLEVMQEQQVTMEGESLTVPTPFMVLATQNPIEQEGTYPLPEAQLDRFLMKILIDYPTEEEEYQLTHDVVNKQQGDKLNIDSISALISTEDVLNIQQQATQVQVDDAINRYAVDISRATRNWPAFAFGSGPRGGISLIRAAKARALMEGRDYVVPDDVTQQALAVLRHRVQLTPDMELEGETVDNCLTRMIEKIAAPRQ